MVVLNDLGRFRLVIDAPDQAGQAVNTSVELVEPATDERADHHA
jgi:hypothetical protein